MGCWNGTCGLTNLPIRYDQPVAIFLLAYVAHQMPDQPLIDRDGARCSPAEMWAPIGLPMFGKYDDYGSADSIAENWNTAFLSRELTRRIIDPETQKRPEWDADDEIEGADQTPLVVRIVRFLRRKSLLVAGIFRPVPMGVMLAHRSAYEALTLEMQSDHAKWLHERCESGDVFKDGVEAYRKILATIDTADEFRSLRLPRSSPFSFLDMGCSHELSGYGPVPMTTYAEVLRDLARERAQVDDPRVVEVLSNLSSHLVFQSNFYALRRTYMPQAGAGSQSTDYGVHLAAAKTTILLAKAGLQWEGATEDDDSPDESAA